MQSFTRLEPFPDPNNKMGFLLDWELTQKCNLDCTYCGTGYNGGHDNTTQHPPVNECLVSLDFMYQYVDLYMQHKLPSLRSANLNVYGGEALAHPDIVEILQAARNKHQQYRDHWSLGIVNTTNAVVSQKKLAEIIPLIDHFTVSYHTENSAKQKQQFRDNVLMLRDSGRSLKCIVLMHTDPELFADAQQMLVWLRDNNIASLPRQLDHPPHWQHFTYNEQQIAWFNQLYQDHSYKTSIEITPQQSQTDLTEVGRACCGGRQLCMDQNFKKRDFFVQNKFSGWYCSVNWFFLYVKQVYGDVYVNKDCKMNFDGTVSPIGHLRDTAAILNSLRDQLAADTLPVIQCRKPTCFCGLCAPKAQDLNAYNSMIRKYKSR